jgi:carbon storage regulator
LPGFQSGRRGLAAEFFFRPTSHPTAAFKEDEMLVLSRKLGEKIVIAGDIVVTVVEVRGDRVKLAFEAPAAVPIHRSELHDRIQRQESQLCVAVGQ